MLRIKDICIEKGITLQELARRLNITYQSLYESIKGNPSLSRLKEIASALGVSVSELFVPANSQRVICPHCGKSIYIEINVNENSR